MILCLKLLHSILPATVSGRPAVCAGWSAVLWPRRCKEHIRHWLLPALQHWGGGWSQAQPGLCLLSLISSFSHTCHAEWYRTGSILIRVSENKYFFETANYKNSSLREFEFCELLEPRITRMQPATCKDDSCYILLLRSFYPIRTVKRLSRNLSLQVKSCLPNYLACSSTSVLFIHRAWVSLSCAQN